jgi:hypothetical protein
MPLTADKDATAKCSAENKSGHDIHINTDAHASPFIHILASKGEKPSPSLPTSQILFLTPAYQEGLKQKGSPFSQISML